MSLDEWEKKVLDTMGATERVRNIENELRSNWRWLASTRQLQEESFDVEYPLKDDDLANYVMYNTTALLAEVGEFLQEVQWKPWAQPRGAVDRERALAELVDVGHFVANLLCAIDVTDDEWEEAYRRKQAINARRQVDGYDGVSTKCPDCRRALDETGVVTVEGAEYCRCGRHVGSISDW